MVRDMTKSQFYAALARNGFGKPIIGWVEHRDIKGVSFGLVVKSDGTIARRASIAHLIKRRDEHLSKSA